MTAAQNEETFPSDWTSSRENTFHMYCTLRRATLACFLFLSDCGCQSSQLQLYFCIRRDAVLLIRACLCVHCVLFRCLLYSKNTYRNHRWSTLPGNREPFFPAMLTSCCKQGTDGRAGRRGCCSPVVFARKSFGFNRAKNAIS